MGYIRHHAIVVTSWYSNRDKDRVFKDAVTIERARRKAKELIGDACPITPIVDGVVNGYRSFLIAPDGSKEGWDDSDRGDEARERFVKWLKSEGARFLDWVFVSFPGDDDEPRIIGPKRED